MRSYNCNGTVYECSYCGKTFNFCLDAYKHEPNCHYNPSNKYCISCVFCFYGRCLIYGTYRDSDSVNLYGCERYSNELTTENKNIIMKALNLSKWEDVSKIGAWCNEDYE